MADVHCIVHSAKWHYPLWNKMTVLLLCQQQCEKNATLLHVIVDSTLGLVVDILKICESKVTKALTAITFRF
jgi:hypothetical protein